MEGVKSGAGAVSIQLPVDGSLDGVAGRNQSPDLPLQGRFIWSRWSGVSPTPYFSLTILPPPSNTIQSQGSCVSQSFTLPSKSNLTEYWLRQPGAPGFLAWVGAPGGNPRPAPGGADMECLHAMRTLAGHGPPGGSGLPAGRLVELLPGGEPGVGALRMSRPVLGAAGADAG